MDVEYAFLADAAQECQRKLFVIGGGIDRIFAPQVPVVHPAISLVLKIRVHPTECSRDHALEVQFWDRDGEVLGEVRAKFSAKPDKRNPTRDAFVQLVLNFFGQAFPRFGDYAFYIVINGERKKALNLYVEQMQLPGLPELGEGKGTSEQG